ncbi:urease accessory protein UreF [Sneathiella aquimaris]|uniref:urease accessory protein UreF n=1 Tax=Sneathiella aquimaris TaxID=2599305 RepID=UPI00146B8ED7|nr:urease accessory protein UreF [Sneathiella aquimaris]
MNTEHDLKDSRALIRLLTWMSPAFPLGSFSYSHGLETVIQDGRCHSAATLQNWLETLLREGGAWSDAVFLCHAWQIKSNRFQNLKELNDLALAFAPSHERYVETVQQGNAFFTASKAWPRPLHETLERQGLKELAFPVAVGAIAKSNHIDQQSILLAYLHAFVANLCSVAMRLVPLGQSDGLAVQAALEGVLLDVADTAKTASLDALGGSAIHSDIAAMRHENLTTRIFRS